MSETNKRSESSWGALVGSVYKYETINDCEGINPTDLIVLTTKNGTKVCPTKQFETGGDGNPVTTPHVGLGWKIEKLSGLSEWACAGGFFAPRQGRATSFCEELTNAGKNLEEKMKVIREMLSNEQKRAILTGTLDNFEATVQNLSTEYETDLLGLIEQEHEI